MLGHGSYAIPSGRLGRCRADLENITGAGGGVLNGTTISNIEAAAIGFGSGADKIWTGATGEFALFMGDGDDFLTANLQDDWLAGGAGSDSIHGAGGGDRIWGMGPGNFGAVDIDYIGMTLNGTDDGLGDDRLYGEAG